MHIALFYIIDYFANHRYSGQPQTDDRRPTRNTGGACPNQWLIRSVC